MIEFNCADENLQKQYKAENLWLKIKQSECNLNCVFCPPESRHKSELTFSFLVELIRCAREVGLKRIWWTGGEPFLFARFGEVVSYASKLGFEQKITTNGLLLHKYEEIINCFSRVNISFHSLKREIYSDITNGGNLSILQRNISMIAGKTLVKLNIVLGKYNVNEVNSLIVFANNLSVIPRFILLRDRSCKKSIENIKVSEWVEKNYITKKQLWNEITDTLESTEIEGNNIKASYYKAKDYIFGVVQLSDKCEEEHCNVIFVDSKKQLYNCRGLNRENIDVQDNLIEDLNNVIKSKKENHGNICSSKGKN